MPDLIPGSGFDDLLKQVAVPTNYLISNSQYAQTPDPQAFLQSEFSKSLNVPLDLRAPEVISPFAVDPSSRFPLQVLGMDNEDLYSQGQGVFDKAINAIGKGLILTGTTFAQSTIGLLAGLSKFATTGEFSSLYDNEFNRWMDNINKNSENALPNYYSAAERERPWYSNIFTANFFWDKIVKNLGFMAGAALSGSVFARMLQAGKLVGTGNALNALKTTEEALITGKTADSLGKISKGFGSLVSSYDYLNKSQRVLVAGLATTGEAGLEALQATDSTRTKLIEDFKVKNGYAPLGEDLKRIEEEAANVGNTVFGLNVGILSLSNYIQFPKLLGSSIRAERGMYHDLLNKAKNVGFDPKTLQYIEQGAKTRFGKLYKKVAPYTFSTTEGLEEVSQYAAQTGSENYFNKKYTGEDANVFDDLINYGVSQAYSPEGQEQFFIGGVSGGIGKAPGTFRQNRRETAATKEFIQQSNVNNLSTYTRDMTDSLKRGAALASTMDDAVRQGDVLEYKDAERDFMINYLYPKIKHDRMDLFHDEVNTYKILASTPEGFKQLQDEGRALPTDTRDAYLARLGNLERVAEAAKSAYQAINTRSAFEFKRDKNGIVRDSKGNPVPKYSEEAKEKLVYASSKIMDYDERIPELALTLIPAGIDTDSIINDPKKLDEYSLLIDSLTNINGQTVTQDMKEDLKVNLKDLAELSLRRKQFVEEYNDILINPDRYQGVQEAPKEVQKVTVKTKSGEEEIEVGTEYYLGNIVKETEEGFLSEKYPRFTVLAVNADGSLRIKDASGVVRTIDPKELEGYKLGKVSDVQKNPKANFYMRNHNKIFKFKTKNGILEGVLRWSYNKDQLYFEYKKNGKTRRIPVKNEQFSYKIAKQKGYKEPVITATGATLTDIQEADILGDAQDNSKKLENRYNIISEFVKTSRERLSSIDKIIDDKRNQLKDIEESLDNLSKTKAGVPRKKFTKAITKTLQELGETKSALLSEISNLEAERDELQAIQPFFEDFLQNANELPDNTLHLVEDLQEEVKALKELEDHATDAIQQGNSLIERIDTALQTAYKLLNDYIVRLKEENPNIPLSIDTYQTSLEKYLGEEGARLFIEQNEGYTPLVKSLQADISEFSEELEIPINEEKIKNLQEQVAEIRKALHPLQVEIVARSKFLRLFEEKLAEERKKQAEEAELMKNKQLQQSIFTSQKQAEATQGDRNKERTNKDILDEATQDSSMKKSAEVLASSTSSRSETNEPDNTVMPSVLRERNFLYNQTWFPERVHQNLRGVVININNEAKYGLSGLIEQTARQNTAMGWNTMSPEELKKAVTDPDSGVLMVVYAVEKDGEYYALDENGKEIGKLGDNLPLDQVVASTLTSTSKYWVKNGKKTERFRSQDKDRIDSIMDQWRSKREAMFNSSDAQIFNLGFSRGIPVYNEQKGTMVLSNIEGTLFPASKKAIIEGHQGAIKVITTENYTHKDITYGIKPGTVYFEYGDIFAPLTNRNFTKEERETIFKVLTELAIHAKNNGTLKSDYLNYLQNVLFWGTPKGTPGRNQIWIDDEFFLNFGNSGQKVPFTPASVSSNQELINAYLAGTYNNINNHTLTKNFNDKFLEYYLDPQGNLQTRLHKNYQSFILESNFLKTPIIPTADITSNGNRNFMQKYAILQGVEYTAKKPAVETIPFEEIKQPVYTAKTLAGETLFFTARIVPDKINPEVAIDTAAGDFQKAFDRLSATGMSEADILFNMDALATITFNKQYKAPQPTDRKSYSISTIFKKDNTYYGYYLSPAVNFQNKTLKELTDDLDTFRNMQELSSETEQGVINLLNQKYSAEKPATPSSTSPEISAPQDEDSQYRVVNTFAVDRMTTEELNEFKKFINRYLPQFTVEDVNHLILTTSGREAWGRLQGKMITLYKAAEKGTGYHEAFEAVWKYFVTPEQQEEILNEFKNRTGTFKDRLTNTEIGYNEATDLQAKEEIADEFAKYKQGQKLTLGSWIKGLFDRIINFFRSFVRGYKPNTTLTDELFNKISTGGFKSYKLPSILNDTPEYQTVPKLTEAQTHGFVQDITKRIFDELLKVGADLFDPLLYRRKDVLDKIREQYASVIPGLPEGQKTFDLILSRTIEYLDTFGVHFDEENNITINDENQSKNDYVNDKMTLDVKKTSPFAIKFLLSSLAKTQTDTKGNISFKRDGVVRGYELLPFGKTFITLLETFEGMTSVEDMINRLYKLSQQNSDYVYLLNRLGRKSGSTLDWNNLSKAQWRLITGFYNTFNKQRPFTQFLHYNENGEAYFSNAEIGRASEQIKNKWEANIQLNAKNSKGIFTGYNRENKNYQVDSKKLEEFKSNIKTIKGKLDFLNALGIDYDFSTHYRMSEAQRTSFLNQINAIIQYIETKKGLEAVTGKSLGISGPLTTLANIYAKINTPQSESTFLNGEGEQQQVYVQPNYLSQVANVFNHVGTLDELYQKLPYLKTDPFAIKSEILKLGGKFFNPEGERTKVKLVLGYTDSIKDENGGTKLQDLDYPDRIMAQINHTLDGIYYISVPADSSTEWYLQMGEFIDFTTSSGEDRFYKEIVDVMLGYLESEVQLAKDYKNHKNIDNVGDKAKGLRFFKDILSVENQEIILKKDKFEPSESIKEEISRYIKKEIQSLRQTLEYNEQIIPAGSDKVSMSGILDSFAKAKRINKDNMPESEATAVLNYIVGNNIIANMEMHKVIFGDPFNFAIKTKSGKVILDETKRIKSFLSPAAPTITSEHYNNTFNKLWNQNLQEGIPGYYLARDHVSTITYSDVKINSQYVKGFTGVNEADAQALHSLQMHRDLLTRHNQWSNQAERWYQWEMAYTRDALNRKGIKFPYPDDLKKRDKNLLEKPKPGYTLHVIKPIVRGVKEGSNFINPILDKFSSAPLIFSAVEGTNLENLLVKMFQENVDYVIFESGRKLGSEGKNSFYDNNGAFNNSPYIGALKVNWNDYSIQVENSYDEGKQQTRGSQITKLFSLDFFDDGIPIDYTGSNWHSLSEPEKEKASEIYKEIVYNNKLLAEMTKNGYESLLKKLGIIDTGTKFIVESPKKLYDTLKSEAFKRDMPENIKKIFKTNKETGVPYLPLEASSEYNKIQKMLYSIVDKNIVSPKVNGGPKTQLSVVGWEDSKKGRRLAIKDGHGGYRALTEKEHKELPEDQKKGVVLTSDTLKFYTKDDPYIEIMLPHWFKDRVGDLSDLQILEQLNSTKEGKEILRGVGFRIPTSNMSAIETIRVKGFLPQEYGDTIVVPSEITTKAGSDFDIDKLNTYLKNIYVDSKGIIRKIPFYGFGEAAIKELEKLAYTIRTYNTTVLSEAEDVLTVNDLESLPEDEKFNRLVDDLYKKSLENEYFESLERVITHPLNYDRLIQPTEDPTLSELAGKIADLMGTTESNSLTRLLSIDYLSKTRHAFMAGKKWIGIGAVNNTGHSQSQRVQMYIDVKNTNLSQKDKEVLGDGKILLPHNKDSFGRPNLSKIKDTTKKHISEKLGWYLTAFVDIAKDPYILNIIYSRKLVGTFLFLERLGVPTNTIALFMNQPIIREYVHYSDIEGFSRLSSTYRRDQFLANNPQFTQTGPKHTSIGLPSLENHIKNFYQKKQLSPDATNQQLLILDEFIKYQKMSEFLFTFNQSTNWDTTRFTTGAAIRRKQLKLIKEREYNIIKSPDTILNISNNGRIQEAVVLAKEAIESTGLINSPEIREVLNQSLDRYLEFSYLPEKTMEKIDSQLLASFVDYLVQTKFSLNGESLKYLVASTSTSVANKISEIVNSQEKKDQLNNNPIFQNLKVQTSRRLEGGDSISINPFPKEVYDKNLITGYFQELKELFLELDGTVKKGSLYRDIIKLALIQGTGNQSNLLSYIPMEDTSATIKDAIGNITVEDAKNFVQNFNFERSLWKNTDIVPLYPGINPKRQFTTRFGSRVIQLSETFNNPMGILERPLITMERFQKLKFSKKTKTADRWDLVNNRRVNYVNDLKPNFIEKNDFTFLDKVGYQKVFIPGTTTPLTKTETTDDGITHTIYFYKQVNLMGTGYLQEHYTTPQVSVLDNQTVKVATLTDQEIVNEVLKINTSQAPNSFEDFKNGLKRKDC